MKYIKLLSEGASLELDEVGFPKIAKLSVKDTGEPLEFLKNDDNIERKVITDYGNVLLYKGLMIDPNRIDILSGNSKSRESIMFKLLSDYLKGSKIEGGIASIVNFIKPTINKILRQFKGKIDYVMPLGSTANLSNDLAHAILEISPNTQVESITKSIYPNITSALDWDYIINYPKDKKPILNNVKGDIISQISKASDELMQDIRNANTAEELRRVLIKSNPNHRQYDFRYKVVWKNTPFVIRSSGISHGGSRKWYKDKYYTSGEATQSNNPYLYDIVKKCVLNNKTILIVDDNMSSRTDLRGIIRSIETFADKIISEEDISDPRYARSLNSWNDRVCAYVLIDLNQAKLANVDRDAQVMSYPEYTNQQNNKKYSDTTDNI